MKKFFAIFAILACISVCTSAAIAPDEGENLCNQGAVVPSNYVLLNEIIIPANPTSFPYVISVPAPSETVIGVSGPSRPNVNWDIQDGMLNIYLYSTDFLMLADSDPIIEVATNPLMYYYIQVHVSD